MWLKTYESRISRTQHKCFPIHGICYLQRVAAASDVIYFPFLSSLTIPKHQDNVDNAPSNAIWRKFEFIFIDHRLGVEIPWAFISGIFSFVLDDSYGGIKEILIVHLRFSSFIYTTSFCIDLSLSLMLKCFI